MQGISGGVVAELAKHQANGLAIRAPGCLGIVPSRWTSQQCNQSISCFLCLFGAYHRFSTKK